MLLCGPHTLRERHSCERSARAFGTVYVFQSLPHPPFLTAISCDLRKLTSYYLG
jgi:hypothetical protein